MPTPLEDDLTITGDAAAEMRSAGYEVNLLILDGADHVAPVFHDLQDGQFVVVANDPAGDRTVEVILDAIAARSSEPDWTLFPPGAGAARRTERSTR